MIRIRCKKPGTDDWVELVTFTEEEAETFAERARDLGFTECSKPRWTRG